MFDHEYTFHTGLQAKLYFRFHHDSVGSYTWHWFSTGRWIHR